MSRLLLVLIKGGLRPLSSTLAMHLRPPRFSIEGGSTSLEPPRSLRTSDVFTLLIEGGPRQASYKIWPAPHHRLRRRFGKLRLRTDCRILKVFLSRKGRDDVANAVERGKAKLDAALDTLLR
mmetsp:Transcript_23495/g.53887  ORF Transcript_23495/g.53887 Transcript_23495/m.53887 type:complete len:122 (+) Transcript_23495:1131-1496(+)